VVKSVVARGVYENCDALITNVRNIFLTVSIADCAPIFLFDPQSRAMGCVHAGWRGTEQGIVREAVFLMQNEFGSRVKDILAFIGPSAGQCCYEVGKEVAAKFESSRTVRRDEKTFLDIKGMNKDQLLQAGVIEARIEVSDQCTICTPELYHSFRRDRDKSGRMMGVIGMIE
jgi:YfiH family protein